MITNGVRVGLHVFLFNSEEFCIKSDRIVTKDIICLFKSLKEARFDKVSGLWLFKLSIHEKLMNELDSMKYVLARPIPPFVIGAIRVVQNRNVYQLLDKLPQRIKQSLAPYQRNGRIMIADQMGLGKTIQSIAAITLFSNLFPALIIAPSAAKYHWKDELMKWLSPELCLGSDIVILKDTTMTSKNIILRGKYKFAIVSYTIATLLCETIKQKNFQIVIVDEAHYLKSGDALRTRSLLPILHNASKVLLLTGTPALSRPQEMFFQLHALCPNVWSSEREFVSRYCCQNVTSTTTTAPNLLSRDQYNASYLHELYTVLTHSVMIRRLKKDVLSLLPPKYRQVITIGNKQNTHYDERDDVTSKLQVRSLLVDADSSQQIVHSLFCDAGMKKISSVTKSIENFLSCRTNGKLLVFAHHKKVLDAYESFLVQHMSQSSGSSVATANFQDPIFVRIDGRLSSQERRSRVHAFQSSNTCRVALLSITAVGVAISLTAASNIYFAELYWTPGVLLQAEDRAHRIGQTRPVHIKYFLAVHTLDAVLWPLILRKMKLLDELFDGDISDPANEFTMTRSNGMVTSEFLAGYNEIVEDLVENKLPVTSSFDDVSPNAKGIEEEEWDEADCDDDVEMVSVDLDDFEVHQCHPVAVADVTDTNYPPRHTGDRSGHTNTTKRLFEGEGEEGMVKAVKFTPRLWTTNGEDRREGHGDNERCLMTNANIDNSSYYSNAIFRVEYATQGQEVAQLLVDKEDCDGSEEGEMNVRDNDDDCEVRRTNSSGRSDEDSERNGDGTMGVCNRYRYRSDTNHMQCTSAVTGTSACSVIDGRDACSLVWSDLCDVFVCDTRFLPTRK